MCTTKGNAAGASTSDAYRTTPQIWMDMPGGTLNLYSTTIQQNKAKRGGGIYSDGTRSLVNLYNSSIVFNIAATSGGGMYVSRSTAHIYNSNISNNVAEGDSGGGMCIDRGSSASIIDTDISNNTAVNMGGGLFILGDDTEPSHVNLSYSLIKNNKVSGSSQGGGGLYLFLNAIIIIRETTFTTNKARF